jgi:hypothetical protein
MDKQELDGVRRLLEIALKNLSDQGAQERAGGDGVSLIIDRSASFSSPSEAPLVVILARGSDTQMKANEPAGTANFTAAAEPESCGCDPNEKKHSHPGLERFTIEADSRPSVPKTCFIEPGRACVNSGACEMRGF